MYWRVVGHMSRSLVVVLVVHLNRPHGTEPPVGNPHNSGDVIQYVATPRLTASRWLCSQVLLWTTVTLRGANDQEECVPCPFPRILDDASGQAGGTMSWLGVPRSAADRCIVDLSRFACRRQARRYTNFGEGAKFSCNPDQISLRKCV